MIKIFSSKNKKIRKKNLLFFLEFYEKKYLFWGEIPEYAERKRELLKKRRVDCLQFTRWLKENYQKDLYSKCYLKSEGKLKSCSCRTMYGGIEYIHIWAFCEEIIPVIEKAANVKADYLVIDLRDNCGGSVGVLTKSLSCLLKGMGSVEIRDRNEYKKIHIAGTGRVYRKIFILVNENTMSCAEILMMVLYENMENTYIIGGPTFMKDKGQATIGKGKTILSVTNFCWYVSGKNIKGFWRQSGERIIGTGEHLGEQDMMKLVYSQML